MNAETNKRITHVVDHNHTPLYQVHLLGASYCCKIFIGVLLQPQAHVMI